MASRVATVAESADNVSVMMSVVVDASVVVIILVSVPLLKNASIIFVVLRTVDFVVVIELFVLVTTGSAVDEADVEISIVLVAVPSASMAVSDAGNVLLSLRTLLLLVFVVSARKDERRAIVTTSAALCKMFLAAKYLQKSYKIILHYDRKRLHLQKKTGQVV